VFAGYPGAPKSTRQVQASSGLFFEVFKQYDADNLLLAQAGEEVLREELDVDRLEQTLERISELRLDLHHIKRPTPLGFPLLVERMRESMSSEKLSDRIRRMVGDLEKVAETGKA
jgi:ATP-dependent Lhr-like helicase